MASTQIPNRAAFKSADVCAITGLQPYVLRTWEAEFPDLGATTAADGPRVYRKSDVERVLKLKHLILVEGLTLAGARRKMMEADGQDEPEAESMLPALLSAEMRNRIRDLKRGLEGILKLLSAEPGGSGHATDFVLEPGPKRTKPAAAAKRKKR
jgi:DNA-binding transcriptional MerR regulator